MDLYIRSPLKEATKIYRYMTFTQFASLIEQKLFYLTRVQNWEDTWELPSLSIPTKLETGEMINKSDLGEKYLYGSCWTRLGESDAMWRIYAPQRDGILIKTSIKKFKDLRQFSNGYISNVYYYNDLYDGLGKVFTDRSFWRPYSLGLIKRKAFQHEKEVRFLFYKPPSFNLEDLLSSEECPNYVYSSFEPNNFIEEISIDPRADEWFVNMVINYCLRAGLRTTPKKSKLYSKDIYVETGIHFVERTYK